MPRRNYTHANGRSRAKHPAPTEYRTSPPAPTTAATTSPTSAIPTSAPRERHCGVCAGLLPRKWPHPNHASCNRTANPTDPTERETTP